MENTLFNHLIGEWEIQDYVPDVQGRWKKGQGADWIWNKTLNGNAFQDNWISPPIDKKFEKSLRQWATVIRIFNPKKQQWEMAWMTSQSKQIDTFTAIETQDKVVMKGFYSGYNTKITFSGITSNSFNWKMEFEQADKSWLEVYRMKGTKKSE
jgi:hypothetical protein